MKIIDILNKIANGEEIPHIQYDDVEAYIGADGYLKDTYGDNVEWWIDKVWLNTEVEIIEEDKKIENIDFDWLQSFEDNDKQYTSMQVLFEKIDEIIDYLNKEK